MGGLPNGFLSGYGLLPTLTGMAVGMTIGFILALPFTSNLVIKARDYFNPALRLHVRDLVFAKFASTGKVEFDGYAVSTSGKMTAHVKMTSAYDAGLGFTMLSACTTACAIVDREKSSNKAKVGFQTAVTALGGKGLAERLRKVGVETKVTTQRVG